MTRVQEWIKELELYDEKSLNYLKCLEEQEQKDLTQGWTY